MAQDPYQPYGRIRRLKDKCGQIDTHELLKNEMSKQDAEGTGGTPGAVAPLVITPVQIPDAIQSLQNIQNIQNPQYGFTDNELYFDSLYRDTSSNFSIGELKWSIPAQNNLQDIKNCIELTIDGKFFFPKVFAPTNAPEFFYFRKLYMFIESAQIPSTGAIIGVNGNKFHFEFDIDNLTGQAVLLTPVKKSFFFSTPITSISDFWVRFLVPTTNPLNPTFIGVPIPVEQVTIFAIGLLPSPGPMPVAAFSAIGGSLSNGNYQYVYTDVSSGGIESAASPPSIVGNPGSNTGSAAVSGISVGPVGTISRNLYRTTANGSTFLLLTNIANNVTTTYNDTTADSGLGTAIVPSTSPFTFSINPPYDTTVLGPIGSLGTPGVAVFITGYPTAPGISTSGNFVTTVNSINQFTLSVTSGAGIAGTANMFIPKNRIAFPFRFTSVVQQISNYISVTHL